MVQQNMFITIRSKKTSQVSTLQDPSQINGDSLNTVKYDANRHFTNKKREYLKSRINEHPTHSRSKNIREE
jgi:hypothetical protein